METPDYLHLNLQRQTLQQNDQGRRVWSKVVTATSFPARQSALLLCDVWDRHWSRGAHERLGAMVARMNDVVRIARERGVQIIHAPSDVVDFYKGTPARTRAQSAPKVALPYSVEHHVPHLPIDDSDGGSDTDDEPRPVWTKQHAAIDIDQERDVISCDGVEIYSVMRQSGITNLLVMGVHTNMCVMNRTFGIKQMVGAGVHTVLIRDLTDAMYNPARSPYVSHEEGTKLMVDYIEKFWCPTVSSKDVTDNSSVKG